MSKEAVQELQNLADKACEVGRITIINTVVDNVRKGLPAILSPEKQIGVQIGVVGAGNMGPEELVTHM